MMIPDTIVGVFFGGALGVFGYSMKSLREIDHRLNRIEAALEVKTSMKKSSIIAPMVLALASIALLTGCNLEPILKDEEVVQHVIGIPAQEVTTTNGTEISTTIIPTSSVTNFSTNVVYRVNPTWQTSIQTAQTINSMANPTPTAPLVNLALGGLVALLGWVAKIKSGQLSTQTAISTALVSGVEKLNDPKIKQMMTDVATAHGVQDALHTLVKGVTKT